jgi:hypothetical protein
MLAETIELPAMGGAGRTNLVFYFRKDQRLEFA